MLAELLPRPRLTIFSMSCMVAGRAAPLVSGRRSAASPPPMAAPPNMRKGRLGCRTPSPAIKGAMKPPSLAQVAVRARPSPRTEVGYSSPV